MYNGSSETLTTSQVFVTQLHKEVHKWAMVFHQTKLSDPSTLGGSTTYSSHSSGDAVLLAVGLEFTLLDGTLGGCLSCVWITN